MTRRPEPPAFAMWMLTRVVGDDAAASSVIGDLHEEWETQRRALGDVAANAWYKREARGIAMSWIKLRLGRVFRGSRTASQPSRRPMSGLSRDFSYALRSLHRGWRFAAGVVLSLGLAVGLGVPVLGLADHFFLRPPPGLADPDRLVRVVARSHGSNGPYLNDGLTGLDYAALSTQARAIDGVAGFVSIGLSLGRGADARSINATLVTASYFSVLGVRPVIGRTFTEAEDVEGATEAPVVVSHRFWQRDLNGASDALGKRLIIGSVTYTVVGVAPEGFNGLGFPAIDVWLPVHVSAPEFQGRDPRLWTTDGSSWLRLVARLRPDVSLDAATSDFARVYRLAGTRARDTELKGTYLLDPLQPGRSSLPNRSAKVALWLSAGGVLLLVLVAANLVSLFIARTAAQRHQLAIRLAIGGGWRDLLRLHLVETLILGASAAVVGLAVSIPAVRVARALLLPGVLWTRPTIDVRIAIIAFGLALLVGVFVAAWSSAQAARVDPAELLRGAAGGRATSGRQTHRLRQTLLVTQAAIFVVLLSGAGAFVMSLRRATTVDVGFALDGLMSAIIPMTPDTPRDIRRSTYARARERIAALPEVETAALGYMEPWYNNTEAELSVPGSTVKPPRALLDIVSPEHARTFGLQLRGGRWIDSSDVAGSAPVIVINETLARTFWPQGTALGQCIRIGADSMPCRTIVGIVRDARVTGSMDGAYEPVYYMALAQTDGFRQVPHLFFRTRGDAAQAQTVVRRALQELEPNLPAVNVHPVQVNVAWLTAQLALGAAAFSAFGVLAAIIATIGLYSVLSFLVVEQRRETAVRLALGAMPGALGWSVARRALLIVIAGMLIGFIALVPLAKVLEPMLFRTRLLDGSSLAIVVAIGAVTALLGALMPMRAILRTSAASALRE